MEKSTVLKLKDNFGALRELTAGRGTIRERILKDAAEYTDNPDERLVYIKTIAENGCIGGSCRGLIYYAETHAFYELHAEEIDEILAEYEEKIGIDPLCGAERHGDLRNWLAWFAYEVEAQKVIEELEQEV